jgi:chloramphenicol-sensitive protein RarD
MIAFNWYLFIYAVETNRTLSASLGYYINPLVSVLLGVIFIRERLRTAQIVAVVIAAAGVTNQIVAVGVFPWIAISLAVTFGFYGLLRKQAPVSPLIGLMVECLILLPIALILIGWRVAPGAPDTEWATPSTYALLMLAGVVTAIPLLCFAAAARRLRLSTMGFLQYLSPTLQFALAIFAFGEPFGRAQLLTFALIWIACGIFSLDSILVYRARSAKSATIVAD